MALEDLFREEDIQAIEKAHDRIVADHKRAKARKFGYWGTDDEDDLDIEWPKRKP